MDDEIVARPTVIPVQRRPSPLPRPQLPTGASPSAASGNPASGSSAPVSSKAKPVPSPIRQITEMDDRPKIIHSIRDLPRQGYLMMPDSAEVGLPVEARKHMAIWSVIARGDTKSRHVWMLVVESFIGTTTYHSYRQALRRAGFKVEHTPLVHPEILVSLYDAGQQSGRNEDLIRDENNQIIQFYERMVAYAVANNISDIHVERRMGGQTQIRMRQHGELFVYREVGAGFANSLVMVIHNVLAENQDVTFVDTEFQQASVNTRVMAQDVMLRYQSMPAYPSGLDVILRVLPLGSQDEPFVEMEALGFSAGHAKTIYSIVNKPQGALLIAGTTGSGKSTTLKNLLMSIDARRESKAKIYTIEDPPEYRIPNVTQVPVVRRRDDDGGSGPPPSLFGKPLAAVMRADPDVIMIGEIRDEVTADGMKRATQSGHEVLTTTHAGSALDIIPRLLSFGLSPNDLGSPGFVTGMLFQRLVPQLCPSCAIPLLTAAEQDRQGLESLLSRLRYAMEGYTDTAGGVDALLAQACLRGPGCKKCQEKGIVGRTVCAELIEPDFVMLGHFRNHDMLRAYAYWRGSSDGLLLSDNMTGKMAVEHALQKVIQGQCSPIDVEKLLDEVDLPRRRMESLVTEGLMAQARQVRQAQAISHQ